MTKKEKEILHWMIERSWEKKANPVMLAAVIAQLFPDNPEEVSEMITNDCDCDKEKNNEDNI